MTALHEEFHRYRVDFLDMILDQKREGVLAREWVLALVLVLVLVLMR